MDKAKSKHAAEPAPRRRSAAREDEDGTRERILRDGRAAVRRARLQWRVGARARRRRAVNIASIGYHFDNKEGLLSEVYRRHCEPMIEERLRGLKAASRLRGRARVAAIIEAFIRPALRQVEVGGRRDVHPPARRAFRREFRAAGKAGGGELRPVEHRLHRRAVRMPAAPVANRRVLALSLPARHHLLHRGRTAPHFRVFQRALRSLRHRSGDQRAGPVHDAGLPCSTPEAAPSRAQAHVSESASRRLPFNRCMLEGTHCRT